MTSFLTQLMRSQLSCNPTENAPYNLADFHLLFFSLSATIGNCMALEPETKIFDNMNNGDRPKKQDNSVKTEDNLSKNKKIKGPEILPYSPPGDRSFNNSCFVEDNMKNIDDDKLIKRGDKENMKIDRRVRGPEIIKDSRSMTMIDAGDDDLEEVEMHKKIRRDSIEEVNVADDEENAIIENTDRTQVINPTTRITAIAEAVNEEDVRNEVEQFVNEELARHEAAYKKKQHRFKKQTWLLISIILLLLLIIAIVIPIILTQNKDESGRISGEIKSTNPPMLPSLIPSQNPSQLPSESYWEIIGQDIDGEADGDWSGFSVSLSADGNTIAIGAPFNDENGPSSGHVRVYAFVKSSWVKIGQDIDGEADDDRLGRSVSLADDGKTVAIGAIFNDGNGLQSGHVRVYSFLSGSWVKQGQDIDGKGSYANSGWSVSLSADGKTVAIGARKYNVDRGLVQVYSFINSSWVKIGQDIEGEGINDQSGLFVSLSADAKTVAIGAPYNDGIGPNSGHVRVYAFVNSSWVKIGQDIDGEANDDNSGWSVSLSADGNTVAIGAPYNDGNGLDSGHVRVYSFANSSWLKQGQDIDGEDSGDNSGYSVSLSADGKTVAIGATSMKENGSQSGHVRVYSFANDSWERVGQDIDGEDSGDNSGYSVSLSDDGKIVAIGAIYNDGNGQRSGHVRVYSFRSSLN